MDRRRILSRRQLLVTAALAGTAIAAADQDASIPDGQARVRIDDPSKTARVELDGKPIERGNDPVLVLTVSAGDHLLVVNGQQRRLALREHDDLLVDGVPPSEPHVCLSIVPPEVEPRGGGCCGSPGRG